MHFLFIRCMIFFMQDGCRLALITLNYSTKKKKINSRKSEKRHNWKRHRERDPDRNEKKFSSRTTIYLQRRETNCMHLTGNVAKLKPKSRCCAPFYFHIFFLDHIQLFSYPILFFVFSLCVVHSLTVP